MLEKNLSKLVSNQISGTEHKKYYCDGRLLYFSNITFLKIHQDRFTQLPQHVNQLKFKQFKRQIKVPFIVYADLESILKPIETCEPNSSALLMNPTDIHEPYSFAYLIKSSFGNSITTFVEYRGERAAEQFVSRLETDLRELYFKYLKNSIPTKPLSPEEDLSLKMLIRVLHAKNHFNVMISK